MISLTCPLTFPSEDQGSQQWSVQTSYSWSIPSDLLTVRNFLFFFARYSSLLESLQKKLYKKHHKIRGPWC